MASDQYDRDWKYRGQLDTTDTSSLTTSICEAIGAAKKEDPTDTSCLLDDHIDPDALGQLFEQPSAEDDATWAVTFTIDDLDVTISANGEIIVC